MSPHHVLVVAVATLALNAVPSIRLGAQAPTPASSQMLWENDRLRVDRISLAPGQSLAGESAGGGVIVFLTADLDGRIPSAEAAWRDSGAVNMENRGRARFEALRVELKSDTPRSSGVTPAEVVRAEGMLRETRGYGGTYGGTYGGMSTASVLVRNDHVSVTKIRYPADSSGYFDPLHLHPQDAVVIYLRGGYAWPATWYEGPDRVRRGDVRIVPANVYHSLGNAGSDPLEFLLIIPS